jgi:hypothetical protein
VPALPEDQASAASTDHLLARAYPEWLAETGVNRTTHHQRLSRGRRDVRAVLASIISRDELLTSLPELVHRNPCRDAGLYLPEDGDVRRQKTCVFDDVRPAHSRLSLDRRQNWRICEPDTAIVLAIRPAPKLLKERGPALGRPAADRIKGFSLHNLKELR